MVFDHLCKLVEYGHRVSLLKAEPYEHRLGNGFQFRFVVELDRQFEWTDSERTQSERLLDGLEDAIREENKSRPLPFQKVKLREEKAGSSRVWTLSYPDRYQSFLGKVMKRFG